MFRRPVVALAVVVTASIVAAACGSGESGSDGTIPPPTPVPTVAGVGAVPAAPTAIREPIVVVRPPVQEDGTEAKLIGELVDGNRVLLIGDSILASTSSRYGDQMCEALVPLGWQVDVEAEPSRFVDFGNRVLDKLLPDDVAPEDDWDAAVVFLGSNYGNNALRYEAELVRILDRLAPRPTLLLTVTEYRPSYVEVNEVVERLGSERENVTVLDWKTISETPGILSGDRLHPTDTGRRVLAESVAAALGPVDGIGECLRPSFRDDSAVRGDTSTVLGRPSSGSGSATTTTTRPTSSATTSTVAGGSGGTGVSSTTVPSTGGATTTAPPTTVATTAPTTPAPTSPPTTAPPTTAAQTTAPPLANGSESGGSAQPSPTAP
jgi:lysophospholipase L1-like esterase